MNSSILDYMMLGRSHPIHRNGSHDSHPSCAMPRTNEMNMVSGLGWYTPMNPITMHRSTASNSDMDVYASLARLFGGADSNVHTTGWYQFVMYCVETRLCIIQDICDRFPKWFLCEEAELVQIRLKQKVKGSVNLSVVPSTVKQMNLERNSLTEIFGIDQLAGKRLWNLNIRYNPLDIDLKHLVRSSLSTDNPLRSLWVTAQQIRGSLNGALGYPDSTHFCFDKKVHDAAKKWINSSILDYMMIGRYNAIVRAEGSSANFC